MAQQEEPRARIEDHEVCMRIARVAALFRRREKPIPATLLTWMLSRLLRSFTSVESTTQETRTLKKTVAAGAADLPSC